MPGRQVKIYMSEEDEALWDYGKVLLGSDRCRRLFLNFLRGPFQETLKREAAAPERKDEARQAMKERMAQREQRKASRKERANETA